MKKPAFYTVFIRSFALQAVWNFERLQNIGFAYALQPVMARLYPDPLKRREMLLRHLGFFNVHPYMVNIILGMVIRTEEEIAHGRGSASFDDVAGAKNAMAGPLAAIGDAFFWATWRPFVALLSVGILLVVVRFHIDTHVLVAPLFFIVVYNVFQIGFRYISLLAAYRMHDKILSVVGELKFQNMLDRVRFFGMAVLVCIMGFYVMAFSRTMYDGIWFLAVFMGAIFLGMTKLPPLIVFYGVVASGVAMYLIRGYG